MLTPKPRRAHRHWASLSDDQLLTVELTTDDPESLEGVVYDLPPGDEEPYVEYMYDLRGSEREMLRCVHGNHPHLAGYVMRKGNKRFFVGHICGKNIYGEDFEHYTSDFNAARNRQDALRRIREIRQAAQAFLVWLATTSESECFRQFNRVRGHIRERMPWMYDNLERAGELDYRTVKVQLPHLLFAEKQNDPRADFAKLAADFSAATMTIVADPDGAARTLGKVKNYLELLARRVETVLDRLHDLEKFFQPSVLSFMCDLANSYDNPKKRRYEAGLMSITCKRDRERIVVDMPRDYTVPDRHAIEAFRSALSGVQV